MREYIEAHTRQMKPARKFSNEENVKSNLFANVTFGECQTTFSPDNLIFSVMQTNNVTCHRKADLRTQLKMMAFFTIIHKRVWFHHTGTVD